MARTDPANAANATYGAESTAANTAENQDIGQYNQNIGKLNAGVDVGADPFQQTGYLSNVNKLQAEALDTNAASTKGEMARRLKATGGINGSQTAVAQKDVGLQTGRLADTLTAQRAATDYKSNLQYQQYLAQAPLQAANAEQGIYSTATGGQGNALNNLTALSGQQYNMYGQMIGGAASGIGAGLGGYFNSVAAANK